VPARLVLVIEYDGTNYHGSQRQARLPTVQAELEKALQALTGEKISIRTASRTDSGVHARGQVVSFRSQAPHTESTFKNGLNHYLPDDITVRACRRIEKALDVRRDAVSREYRYYILNRAAPSALRRQRAAFIPGELDIAAMNKAGMALRGERNLASFASRLSRSNVRRMVRTMHRAEVTRHGEMVIFTVVANSFLPHQVRNTAGALIRLGLGRMTLGEFYSIIEAEIPGLAGPAAPAGGLYLERVNYPAPIEEIIYENL